jgi:hypothetical protein
MGSDRARSSYDPAQKYRAVIRQQGRVTLEADENEAWLIESEERRADVSDIIGVTGTPDDGYLITPGANFDFTIQPGTMYVGGERVELVKPAGGAPNPYSYLKQPDWLTPTPPVANPALELVYLYLLEQEISAVEDPDLKDVALGGPDTSARLRLMQHVERIAVSEDTCADAVGEAVKDWLASGLRYDPGSAQLVSLAGLQVGFDKPSGGANVCEPVAQGGYLGADNQLIRVQISAPDKFVWGYDNASFLYRVGSVLADRKTVTLAEQPLDVFHQPRSGQCVEVLRATARLANGAYVAYACEAANPPPDSRNMVTTLASAYSSADQTVVLTDALPAEFVDPNATPMLFVRVWEEQKAIDAVNPVSLGTSGVNVTLVSSGAFHEGDYWTIAVRPSTPTQAYPERLMTSSQPPDGPREWVCPLAVIRWTAGVGKPVDCRNPFDDLVELTKRKSGGCCTVNVAPADLQAGRTLQTIADQYRGKANVTICLAPGPYPLSEPLRLTIEHSGLTIESCDDGADLRAAAGAEAKFLDGLVVLERANSITLRGLRFTLPQVPFVQAGGKLANPDPAVRKRVPPALLADLFVSIGVRAIHCALLTIEECLFRFTVTELKDVLGIGVFAQSECWGLRVSRTRFLHEEDMLRSVAERPFRMLIGYALAPAVATVPVPTPAAKTAAPAGPAGTPPAVAAPVPPLPKNEVVILRAILQDARFKDNLFSGISVATLILADAGVVAFEGNTVRDALGGFWLIAQAALAEAIALSELAVSEPNASFAQRLLGSIGHVLTEPAVLLGTVLVRAYPLPATLDAQHIAGKAAQQTVKPTPGAIQSHLLGMLKLYTGQSYPAPRAKAKTAAKSAAPVATPDAVPPALNTGQTPNVIVVKAQPPPANPLVTAYQQYQRDLAGYELTAFAKRPRHTFFPAALRFVANDVDALVKGVSSSAALIVWGDRTELQGSLVLDANRFRNAAPLVPTAAGLFLERCVVTGNVIVNEAKAAVQQPGVAAPALISLELYVQPETPWDDPAIAVAAVAITGNLFRGKTILPQRTIAPQPPAPMDSWDFFNTTI